MSDSSGTPEIPRSPTQAEEFVNVGAGAEIDDDNSEVPTERVQITIEV